MSGPTHGRVSPEIIGQVECCAGCVETRSLKPFMSVA
jgi:hypothetical protein